MFDLQQQVTDACRNLVESGKLSEMVESHVAKMLDSIFGDALRSYGDVGKSISAAVKTSLAIDPDQLGLAGYNRTVLDIVKRRLDASIQKIGVEKLTKDLDELLGTDAPAVLKLSKLVEQFKEWASDQSSNGRCTIIFEVSQYKSRWLYLDAGERVDKYRCAFSLLIGDDGSVDLCRIYHKNPKETILLGKLYGFERTLFNIYAAGTKIEVDETDFDDKLEREYD